MYLHELINERVPCGRVTKKYRNVVEPFSMTCSDDDVDIRGHTGYDPLERDS